MGLGLTTESPMLSTVPGTEIVTNTCYVNKNNVTWFIIFLNYFALNIYLCTCVTNCVMCGCVCPWEWERELLLPYHLFCLLALTPLIPNLVLKLVLPENSHQQPRLWSSIYSPSSFKSRQMYGHVWEWGSLFYRNGIVFLAESPPHPLINLNFTAPDGHTLSLDRCTITSSAIPLWRGTHFASRFSPIKKHTATNTRLSDAHSQPPCKAQITMWLFLPNHLHIAKCLASPPWHPKTPSLAKDDFNEFYEIMCTKSTLQCIEGFVSKSGIHAAWPGFLWPAPSTTWLWQKAVQ